MNTLPDLQDFIIAEKQKRISAHRQGNLIGFKYTNETIYKQDWDIVTLNSRGIVFDLNTGNVVARPFRKFFNYQEYFDVNGNHSHLYDILPKKWLPNLQGTARYMEKVDGSLGIVFYNPYTKKWQVKTGGSFDSEQAIWAQKWFDKNINTDYLLFGVTYLFEIISPEDIHPIHYDYEGMVLLSGIPLRVQYELSISALTGLANKLGCRMAQVYEFDNFLNAVEWAKKLPKTQEGLVITFENGFKCKAKSDDWCQLAKMFEGLNKWNIWVAYDVEKDMFHAHLDKTKAYAPVDDEPLFIPEELRDLQDYADNLKKSIYATFMHVVTIAKDAQKDYPDRKTQYQYISTHYNELTPSIMKALNFIQNKCPITHVLQYIHKYYEPKNDEVS